MIDTLKLNYENDKIYGEMSTMYKKISVTLFWLFAPQNRHNNFKLFWT